MKDMSKGMPDKGMTGMGMPMKPMPKEMPHMHTEADTKKMLRDMGQKSK